MIRLTIVIASYNRSAPLIRALRSLLVQTLDRSLWEVVVIDNNSPDDTAEKLAEFVAQYASQINIRTFVEEKPGVSHARNRGFTEGAGEYFACLDDDEEASKGWAQAFLEFFDAHPDVAAAGGRNIPLYEYETPRWLTKYTEVPLSALLDLGDRVGPFRGGAYPLGGNMGLRRETIEKYGMFVPYLGRTGGSLLGGEEKDYIYRLWDAGEKVLYVPQATIYHIIPRERLTRGYLSRLSYMVGVSERARTLKISRASYVRRLFAEIVKWLGTTALAFGYTLGLTPSKGGYLFIMRWNITRGLLGQSEK